jgi:catechol 2,3-dioxygenase-like lactoylglutathione lyase family enzyme
MTPRTARVAGACLVALAGLPGGVRAQAEADAVVRGLYHWVHSTGDAERAFAFYHDVLGIELARSPFAGPPPPDAPSPRIVSAADARGDPLVWDLTDTHGARFRTVFMHAPNLPFGLELSEFFDIPRGDRQANPWDPGASIIEIAVRDLDAVFGAAAARGASAITPGGSPIDVPDGRAVLLRDPDGYLLRLVQAPGTAIAGAAAGQVVGAAIGITVADAAASLAFYRDLLGLDAHESRRASDRELLTYGLRKGALTETAVTIPGHRVRLVLLQFAVPPDVAPPRPFRWKLQDVGSPQLQLEVRGLDALIARTQAGGYRFLSVGARPIARPFGRFVFAIDPDGVLVEFVEPAAGD